MMTPRHEDQTILPQCASVSVLAIALTALTVWMFVAASAFAVAA